MDVRVNKSGNGNAVSNLLQLTGFSPSLRQNVNVGSITLSDSANSSVSYSIEMISTAADYSSVDVNCSVQYKGGSMGKGLLGDPPSTGTLVAVATDDSKAQHTARIAVNYILE